MQFIWAACNIILMSLYCVSFQIHLFPYSHGRKESAQISKVDSDSESSISRSRATWIVLLLLEEMLLFLLDSDERVTNS